MVVFSWTRNFITSFLLSLDYVGWKFKPMCDCSFSHDRKTQDAQQYKRLMISLAQANSQVFKPCPYFTSHPQENVLPVSVVSVLKCNRSLRREPSGNVLCKCSWNGEKILNVRLSHSGNKTSCFCIQNQWKNLDQINNGESWINMNMPVSIFVFICMF